MKWTAFLIVISKYVTFIYGRDLSSTNRCKKFPPPCANSWSKGLLREVLNMLHQFKAFLCANFSACANFSFCACLQFYENGSSGESGEWGSSWAQFQKLSCFWNSWWWSFRGVQPDWLDTMITKMTIMVMMKMRMMMTMANEEMGSPLHCLCLG